MKIAAVLLAGGESRRMGRDKATILFGNKPLWKNQLELLRKLNPSELFVSARADPGWRPSDIEFVADCAPSRGPLSGIAATLTQMKSDHLLVLAVDMPFVKEDCLGQICGRIEPDRGVIPMIGNRAEPLSAVYPAEVSEDFQAALGENDFSLQTLVWCFVHTGKMTIYPVAREAESLFQSLNWEQDLVKAGGDRFV